VSILDPAPKVDDGVPDARAMEVLRAGVAASPELRQGFRVSLAFALVVALGRLVVPVAIQQILDEGFGPDGPDWSFVVTACAVAVVAIIGLTLLDRLTLLRLLTTAEKTLLGLRRRAFEHVHELSLAHHNESRRGVLVARVTSDIETLAQFTSWGAIAWLVNGMLVVVALGAMAVYQWQLALVLIVVMAPVLPFMRLVQVRQLRAYDDMRDKVSDTMSTISETVGGIGVLRSYGAAARRRRELRGSVQRQYRSQLVARFYFAIAFPVSDLFSGLALAAVVGVGVWWGPEWGMQAGTLVACLFITNMVVQPIAEIGEVLDQTQTALAGWNKVLRLLDEPVDVAEPERGTPLPTGALAVDVDHVWFDYEPGRPVLRDVELHLPAGINVAVVGETGSGKTTLAKLLCRLADPDRGSVRVGGLDLRDVDRRQRAAEIRLVPQDGFLFDTTVLDNVRAGRPDATDADVAAAFDALGLGPWVRDLPDGLATRVGERGDSLSVGERQLVALARAQVADPGLLILDEATSSIDPETERKLTGALAVLAQGRTTVSIAHRLSTAEAADLVVVFDRGRIVQMGTSAELLAEGGVYGGLHRSWVGNTRQG
jgi:putative ABC transport system ATP-binding protein